MTITIATPAPSRRSVHKGWRPRYEGDFPTLGWTVLQWTYAYLPSPADESQPFTYTDEQARRVLQFYALDPLTGKRLYRRVHEEEAKGWGKSPFGASIALAEFRGPVCFDGWDADGQPVGAPWGTGGRPAPWVQIAAVSEDQTQNTWMAVYGFLTADQHRTARALKIDEGRTRLYQTDRPTAFMERVTASAGSREGQPVTHAVADEPQLWKPSNNGDELAGVLLRNVAKTGGWVHFTGNAPLLGQGSVAEMFGDPAEGALHLANRPSEMPHQSWPDDRKAAELRNVYKDAYWIDPARILADVNDPITPWTDSLRFFFNWRTRKEQQAWMPQEAWAACTHQDIVPNATAPTYACVRVASNHRTAAVAFAQRQGDLIVLRSRLFEPDDLVNPDKLSLQPVETYLRELHELYAARVMGARGHLGGRPKLVPVPGPEVAYDGTFFERSAQALDALGMALVDLPNSQQRIAPAAETLLGLVLAGKLVHDGDAGLELQMLSVEAVAADKGWTLERPADGTRIEAAIAAMVAVHRAMTEEAPKPYKPATFLSF